MLTSNWCFLPELQSDEVPHCDISCILDLTVRTGRHSLFEASSTSHTHALIFVTSKLHAISQYSDWIIHAPSQSNRTTLELKTLNELGRFRNTLINLIRIRTLANCGRGARLATRLTTDNGSNSSGPFGSVGACVLERLCCICQQSLSKEKEKENRRRGRHTSLT